MKGGFEQTILIRDSKTIKIVDNFLNLRQQKKVQTNHKQG